MVCVWVDGNGVVFGVRLKAQESRNKSVELGLEGSRFESKGRSFALLKYLTAGCNFLSVGSEIIACASV